MNFIFSSLIVIFIILLFSFIAAWLDMFGQKHKEKFLEEVIDNVSDKLSMVWNKVGPWYLVVCTKESNRPIWISNNNIRSVHPDPKNRKLIVKLFNGEDMVIDDVESYDFQAGNEMHNYNFQ